MNKNQIINALKNIGFTEYEAKIYISLLENEPQNGNSLSRTSGVPSSKVYEVLRKMQADGFVFIVTNSGEPKSKYYSPLPYQDLIEQMTSHFASNLEAAEASLDAIAKKATKSWTELYNIEGYNTTLGLVSDSIAGAQSEIVIVAWKEELSILLPALKKAAQRGVKIATISFDPFDEALPWEHTHHAAIPKALEKHRGELAIAIDNQTAIVFDGSSKVPNAVVSSYYSLVKTIKNYITHDIYLNKIQMDLDSEIKTVYGEKLEKLYDDTI